MKQNIDKFFNQWQQMPKKKQFFFIAWITGVILLGSALFLEHSSSSRSGDPLALLASTKGQVQYRDANELLWQSSSSNQRFFENDSIATGNSSLARIAFVGGRVLELGSNTQIKITRSISDDEETFSVDLVEGEVKALPVNQKIRQKIAQRLGQKSNSIKKDTELKIAAAGQTFSLLTEDAACAPFPRLAPPAPPLL